MNKLTRQELFSLEQYADRRADFRAQVMLHKQNRKVHIGDHATLYFEDKLTIQYQIQEMLRIEKIFEAAGIEEELDAYNPLIPDGTNLKATFMIEYGDPTERQAALAQLTGIEDTVWAQVDGYDKVFAIADEDLDRSDDEKTSAVHFMRFEFTDEMIQAALQGANLAMGIDHANYTQSISALPQNIRKALINDFD